MRILSRKLVEIANEGQRRRARREESVSRACLPKLEEKEKDGAESHSEPCRDQREVYGGHCRV